MVKSLPPKGKRTLAAGRADCYKFPMTTRTSTPAETVAAGRRLGAQLAAGTAVALSGEVGAGKTCFVQGLVEARGGDIAATSPTFALVHEYPAPSGTVVHLDFYRAGSAEEIWDAARDELTSAHDLIVIEWADRFPDLVPPGAVRVRIRHTGDGGREIVIS